MIMIDENNEEIFKSIKEIDHEEKEFIFKKVFVRIINFGSNLFLYANVISLDSKC